MSGGTIPFRIQAQCRSPSLTARLAELKVHRVDAGNLSLTAILGPASRPETSDPSRGAFGSLSVYPAVVDMQEASLTISGQGLSPFAGMR